MTWSTKLLILVSTVSLAVASFFVRSVPARVETTNVSVFSDVIKRAGPKRTNNKVPSDARTQNIVFAAIQFNPALGDLNQNTRHLEVLIREAASNGAQFIVLPEHALIGPMTDLNLPQTQQRELAQKVWLESGELFGFFARRFGVWIAMSMPEYEPDKNDFFITTLLLDHNGEIVAKSRKMSPRSQMRDGSAARGSEKLLQSVETPLGRIGILSGDDVVRGIPRLAYCGATTILISASWEQADATNWTDTCVSLAKQYGVNLVISTLGSAAGLNKENSGSIILKDGQFAIREISQGLDRVLYGVISHAPQPVALTAPLGLPSVPQPTNEPLTLERVELGRQLFFDANLSRDGRVSCASCHEPSKAFADGRKVAEGVFGRPGKMNTPTVLNSAYKPYLSWNGAVESLEAQVLHATQGWSEMSLSVEEVARYLDRTPRYRESFRTVNGNRPIVFNDMAKCLADYVRTLVSADSPFDRYYFGKRAGDISNSAKRGFELFQTKANCASCHQIKEEYALFMDGDYHNTGVGYQKRFDYLGYSGDGLEGNLATKNSFRGEYLTPSLRNVALTSPYMHDGSLANLAEVVKFYNRGGIENPHLDPRMKPLGLTKGEQKDLVEFLLTLNSKTSAQIAAQKQITARLSN